jgi:hypothetical protein
VVVASTTCENWEYEVVVHHGYWDTCRMRRVMEFIGETKMERERERKRERCGRH